MNYYNKAVDDCLKELGAHKEGLSTDEAAHASGKYGKNTLYEPPKKGVIRIFLEQFADLLVVILIISAIISIFTGNGDSAVVILLVIIMNAILGTVQHFKAEKSLDSLKALSAPIARVIRNGVTTEIPSADVTVGDILLLEAGNIAPADGRIMECSSFTVNESSLTGEFLPVEKNPDKIANEDVMLGDRKNMVFSSSLITNGHAKVLVTSIGMNTELGTIATQINRSEKRKTPLQKSLDGFSKVLSFIILGISAVVMILSLMRGETIGNALMFAVALAVAAIPEALSSIVTIALAIGTQKMAKANAIIKDLKAVEGLGCVSVICSDKTGTLTQNKMTVREVYPQKSDIMDCCMALCNDGVCSGNGATIGDPTETALLDYVGAEKCNELICAYKRLNDIPFDSDRKLMSTLQVMNGKTIMLTKGATDMMLPLIVNTLENNTITDVTDAKKDDIKKANLLFSQKGMRVLAFGMKEMPEKTTEITTADEYDFTFLGLAAMTDPPREESKDAVADCIKAGIKPIMITGDHKITATAIAREVGIAKEGDISLDGAELEAISDEELTKILPQVSVYARVSPSHKIRIVDLWQKEGAIVAMTGDGVNDAPALKKADVGVAMGITGTEVSKDAASMILGDDNFATIIKAVANGRSIYANIKNSIKFLIGGNTAAIITVIVTVILGIPMPFTAVHLLFINLLTDSLPAIAISMEKADPSVLMDKPRKSSANIMDKTLISGILLQGVLLAAATLVAYFLGSQVSAECAATMSFATLCLARLFTSFNCRGRGSLIKIGLFSNKFCLAAFGLGVLFLSGALFITPLHGILDVVTLTPQLVLSVLGLAVLPTVIMQIGKIVREIWEKMKASKH